VNIGVNFLTSGASQDSLLHGLMEHI